MRSFCIWNNYSETKNKNGKSVDKFRMWYGKTVTVKVSVEKDNSGKYGLSDTEMNKLEAAVFPTE